MDVQVAHIGPERDKPVLQSSGQRSYADIVSNTGKKEDIILKDIKSFTGEPMIVFTKEEVESLSEPFKYTIVGKFSHGKPHIEKIRKVFSTLDLKGFYHIGVIDQKHILIRCHNEEDYLRIWMRNIWFIEGAPMRTFKWTYNFNPDQE